MKAVVVSLILLILMLGGIVTNFLYINHVAAKLDDQLDALPDIGEAGCLDASQKLLAYWETQVDRVGLSVSFPVVDRITEQASILIACAACGDVYGFRTSIALLRDAVGDMRRLEQFKLGNLL